MSTPAPQPVNILLVDDQPGKLLSYEAMLGDLGENLIRANSGAEALNELLKNDVAVILMDVCMPELDGFELAAMIRKHPRFRKTAIIHVSAVNLTDLDRLKGYNSGAVDYISVPIVPQVLRAKVKVFADLYRKTKELEHLNSELEDRITERTEQVEVTAARLRRTEEEFHLLAETIPSIVWSTNPGGIVTYVNQRGFDYSGSPTVESAWPGQTLHPDDRQQFEEGWQLARAEGKDFSAEARHLKPDGSYRWHLTRAVPHRDERGIIAGWFGVTTDIHPQRELAEQLRAADRRKDEFLAMLAHELRNPLAAIRSSVEVLGHPRRSEEQARAGREVIDRQTKHLTRLIDDLVDMNRIARGALVLRKERIDLADIIQTAVVDARGLLAGRELSVASPKEPIHFEGDAVRLSQVFLNLLSNAVKYTAPEGHIGLIAERHGDEAVVRVRDDGIGIAPEALPCLFDMFYQVDRSLERTQGGLGIGLTLARKIVELHGGTIEAKSAGLGEGCEFIVRLPGKLEADPAVSEIALRAAPASPVPTGRRVLVADDNADAALSLAYLLRLSGHEVRTAGDGIEALEVAEEFRPEVTVLDLGMPRLNGYDVARRMRERSWGREMLLIAATGWAKEQDGGQTMEAGFDIHFVKPVDSAALLEILATRAK